MLTDKEKQFIIYWEKERIKQSSIGGKIVNGLPMAVLFSLPIILFLFAVYVFFPDWYSKISDVSSGSLVMALIAVSGCILFFSYFRMHYKWEMNEQLYRELKVKENKNDKFAEAK
jgi:uncharacterized BrkB/YihY/UPF0761 family membrane protein